MTKNPPEGAITATGEGPHIAAAVRDAATRLGVEPHAVQWTLDKSWFRNELGVTISRDSVRVIAWSRDPEEVEALSDGRKWIMTVIELMGLKGDVQASPGQNKTVRLMVDVDAPGRFIGKQGSTLKAIRHLMLQCVGADYPDRDFVIDVADGRGGGGGDERPRDDRRDDRGGDRRDDRGGRDDRRGGDDRGGDRGGDRRGREGGGGRDADTEALKKLAMKIAERVASTGNPELIRKELNSFDRRAVHLAVSEIPGVGTRSIGEGNAKQIEIYATQGGGGEGGEDQG